MTGARGPRILQFLERETRAVDRTLVLMAVASGVADALLLAVINAAVASRKHGGPSWQHLVLFALILALFIYAFRYTLREASRLAEEAVRNVRVRLADKIRRSDLRAVETLGEGEIHARISRETASLTQAVRPLFAAAQSALVLVLTLAYVATVSVPATLMILGLMAVAVAVYLRNRKRFEKGLLEVSHCEDDLSAALTGQIRGFKELRLNRRKGDDAFEELVSAANRTRDTQLGLMAQLTDHIVFVQSFFLVLVGSIPFLLPAFDPASASDLPRIVSATLFMMGPLTSVVIMIPVLSQVNVTVDNLARLETTLDRTLPPDGDDGPLDRFRNFRTLRLEGLGFTYRAPDRSSGFHIGPLDLELRRGEILFLAGGNGSGKTTLLKVLTALYQPSEGRIVVDGIPVDPSNLQSYRELFAAILTDFHLFDKLHGLRNVAPEAVDRLLRQMELSACTSFGEGRFSTLSLSTGQRKRPALVVAFLEDKPIHVFDEVSADQDPRFRAYFYDVLLPQLKREGRTVVVVTHEDRHDRVADRRFGMAFGQLSSLEEPPPAAR